MTDCIFCKIVARSVPSHIIHEDEQLLAFLDIHPIRPGHTLIVTKAHYDTFDEMPPELMAEVGNLAQLLARHMKKLYNPHRVGFVMTGSDVPHVHAHVCPMLDKYDVTSARYITSPNPTFAMPPREGDDALERVAAQLRGFARNG